MKTPWFWVVAGLILILVFSDKSNKPSAPHYADSYPPASAYSTTPQIAPSYPALMPSTFMGYDCTSDCSGHEAGYQWAEEHGIEDPDDCGGNSDSFIEGCKAFAEEQLDQ